MCLFNCFYFNVQKHLIEIWNLTASKCLCSAVIRETRKLYLHCTDQRIIIFGNRKAIRARAKAEDIHRNEARNGKQKNCRGGKTVQDGQ